MQIPTPRGSLLIGIFFYFFLFQNTFSNKIYANQNGNQKITVLANALPLKAVLKQIEKQSGLRFIYSNDAIDGEERVSLNFNQVSLDVVLSSLFSNKGIIWEYREGGISLRVKSNSSRNNLSEVRGATPPNIITGRILDENGMPIPGASIVVKGTNKGTQTGVDGSFSLSNVTEGTILVIISLGFERQEFRVTGNQRVVINLVTAPGQLNEKVVLAYGVSTRKNLIGNVSSIGSKQIESSPVGNPLLALVGRVPGIFINQATGYAGSGVSVQIQGRNSLSNGIDPFYVIDGIPYNSQFLPALSNIQGSSGSNSGNPLSLINPSDIESITILKDAEATSIYGSRAANGAILITTKRGKLGAMKIDLNFQQGWQKVSTAPKLLNSSEYLQMRHEAINNDGLNVAETDYDINGFWDTTRNTNWFKELVGRTAQYTTAYGTISGGSNNLQYRIGGTYHRETAVVPGDFSNQKGAVNFSLNGASNNQKFHFQFTSSYLVDFNTLPNNDLTNYASTLAPTAPSLYNKDGSINWMPDATGQTTFYNPLSYIYNIYNARRSNYLGNSILEYNILPGLNIKSSFGYNSMRGDETTVYPLTSIDPPNRPYSNRTGAYGNTAVSSWIIEPQISYNFSIGNNHFDALLGSTLQQKISESAAFVGIGYNSDAVIKNLRAATRVRAGTAGYYNYRYNALFGRVNYNYNGKYLINLAIRRDGTSRFGADNRFHNFASVGVGWIFSDEQFMKDNLSFLSFGKIRASYGTTGSDQIPDYAFLSLYNVYTVGVPYRGISSLIPNSITNPFLQWEQTKKASIGVDLGFLKDKIILGITRNINKSNNQLVSQNLPYTAGITSIALNLPAKIQNTGWEITLESKNIQSKNFSWTTGFNITVPNNKLLAYPNLDQSNNANVLFIGKSTNTQRVWKFAGVDPETGLYQFFDNKGGVTSSPNFPDDQTAYINFDPKFYGGFQNSFTYKGIGLDILFQFVRRDNWNNFFGYGGGPGSYNTNQPEAVLQRWRKKGDISSHQKFNSDYSINNQYSMASGSDKGVSDASYIRLKNVAFSWSLPDNLKKPLGVADLKLSFQAQNLLTITKYIGSDPETGASSLPPLKTYVVSLQMSF